MSLNIDCKVFTDPNTNITYFKKTFTIRNDRDQLRFMKDVNTLRELHDNPNVTKIYFVNQGVYQGESTVDIVTEYCENNNILKCGRLLQESGQSFDNIVVYYVKKLIKFFAYLQQNFSLSHRDIKPEIILVTRDWDLKIGEFASQTSTIAREIFTIEGSPYYLSPELRAEWINWQTQRNFGKAKYDPHLSDVYSLGLVFLFISTLKEINEDFCDFDCLEENIEKRTNEIKDESIRKIVKMMLTIDSNLRPDFLKLRGYLEETNIFQCLKCNGTGYGYHVSCTSCYRDFHIKCITQHLCNFCEGTLETYCSRCPNRGFKLLEDLLDLCESCRKSKNDSNINNPVVVNIHESNFSVAAEKIICIRCNLECLKTNDNYFCRICLISWCVSCKRVKHSNKCLEIQDQFSLICMECKRICNSNFDEIYYECKKCGYRCIVCLKSVDRSHEECVFLLEHEFL